MLILNDQNTVFTGAKTSVIAIHCNKNYPLNLTMTEAPDVMQLIYFTLRPLVCRTSVALSSQPPPEAHEYAGNTETD